MEREGGCLLELHTYVVSSATYEVERGKRTWAAFLGDIFSRSLGSSRTVTPSDALPDLISAKLQIGGIACV